MNERQKRKGAHTFLVTMDLFPVEIVVSTAEPKQTREWLRRRRYDEGVVESTVWSDPPSDNFCASFTNGVVVIQIAEAPRTPDTISVFGHEAFHAVVAAYDRIDVTHSAECTEVFAYALQYLMRAVLLKFAKLHKPAKLTRKAKR